MTLINNETNIQKGNTKTYLKCLNTHPPLVIGDYKIWGGSCITPAQHLGEFDIYVGFDRGMEENYRHFPWNAGYSFLFYIQDMGVPKNLVEFKKMIGWLEVQLKLGKRIHLGCIGGHGRTGLVLAVLVKQILEVEDAITYVRKGYCEKAVESDAQVQWLADNFGITKVKANKHYGNTLPSWAYKAPKMQPHTTTKTLTIAPVKIKGTIFGNNIIDI